MEVSAELESGCAFMQITHHQSSRFVWILFITSCTDDITFSDSFTIVLFHPWSKSAQPVFRPRDLCRVRDEVQFHRRSGLETSPVSHVAPV